MWVIQKTTMDENIAHLQQLKSEAVQHLSNQCCLSYKTKRKLTRNRILLEGGIETLQQLAETYTLVNTEEYAQLLEMQAKYKQIESNYKQFLK